MGHDLSHRTYQPGDPRLIMQWARRYAKSRTISFLVQWIVIVVMVLVIGVASGLTSIAYNSGSTGLLASSVLLMGISIAVLGWFSTSQWGNEIIWRITNWLYGREGYASYSSDRETPTWLTGLGGGLVIYHLILAMLVSFQVLSVYNMQPASALYMSPFLMVMIRYQDLGLWAWIWPACYALHAVMLLTGLQIPGLGWPYLFRGNWQLLNMIVPVFGYGLLAILVGHAYSRYALYRLKRLTRDGLPHDTLTPGGEAGV